MSAAADALMGIFGFKRVEGEMSKPVEEVRRAAFEKWFNSLPWPMCEKCSRDNGIAWRGFNAALDLICIELPSANNYTGCNLAIEDCRSAIEQTGLGLRVL